MNKNARLCRFALQRTIITALLALVALTGWAQSTKTATIKGYSPALKDGTVATSYIDNAPIANDTVVGGHFTLNVPVAELTHSDLMLNGEGCPNTSLSLYLKPDAVIELTGTDCLYPLWKVDSPIAEQQTSNRIIEYNYDAVKEYVLLCIGETTWGKTQHALLKVLKQTMDLLPLRSASGWATVRRRSHCGMPIYSPTSRTRWPRASRSTRASAARSRRRRSRRLWRESCYTPRAKRGISSKQRQTGCNWRQP